ncbi:hypothetical protein [Thiohalorhabdus methylotrophus]|uniref:Uncharacterized protein n=1 Tax=Thiohalorhabdus methylotrophus TaxID=3242694 RepID=A0ABV4TWK1_9GAMM
MAINPAAPQNPLPNGGESLANNQARNQAANDPERDSGRRVSSNTAEADQRVNGNEAATEGRESRSSDDSNGWLDIIV